jgi:hypothetical protein
MVGTSGSWRLTANQEVCESCSLPWKLRMDDLAGCWLLNLEPRAGPSMRLDAKPLMS